MAKTKIPPYSVASEKIVLGSILREPALLADVRSLVPEADAFFRPDFAALYKAIQEACAERPARGSGELVATLVVTGPFDGERADDELGELVRSGKPAATALVHAGVVAERARRRRLITVLSDIIHEAYYSDEPTDAITRRAHGRLEELNGPEATTPRRQVAHRSRGESER